MLRYFGLSAFLIVSSSTLANDPIAGASVAESAPGVQVFGMELPVRSLDATVEFYRSQLGFAPIQFGPGWSLLGNDGARLLLRKARLSETGPAIGAYVNYRVDDLNGTLDQWDSAGVQILDVEPHTIAIGRAVTFEDPSGNRANLIEITAWKPPPAPRPKVFNIGMRFADLSTAERFYCGGLGFAVSSRDYLPRTLPLALSGTSPLTLHHDGSVKHNAAPDVPGSLLLLSAPMAAIERWTALGTLEGDSSPDAGPWTQSRMGRDPAGHGLRFLEAPLADLATPFPGSPTERAPALSQFDWLAGTWRAEDNDAQLEETWSEPHGDQMLGMFRWSRGGKVWLNELMSITVESDGKLVFRLRHFDRAMVPWEEKQDAFYYPLARFSGDEFIFENPARDKPRRFIYRRTAQDELLIRIEGPDSSSGESLEHKLRRVRRD